MNNAGYNVINEREINLNYLIKDIFELLTSFGISATDDEVERLMWSYINSGRKPENSTAEDILEFDIDNAPDTIIDYTSDFVDWIKKGQYKTGPVDEAKEILKNAGYLVENANTISFEQEAENIVYSYGVDEYGLNASQIVKIMEDASKIKDVGEQGLFIHKRFKEITGLSMWDIEGNKKLEAALFDICSAVYNNKDGFNVWRTRLERILQDKHDFTDSEISYFSGDFEKYFDRGLVPDRAANILVRRKYRELDESVSNLDEHKNRHPLKSEHFVKYFKKLLALWGFTERKKNTDPKPMTYLYTSGQNASMFEISEKGEYDDEIIVNVLNSSIAADGAVYTIVADDISYNGDNIEEFKEDLDIVFRIR